MKTPLPSSWSLGQPVQTEMTGGRGADHCIDSVSLEAHDRAIGDVRDAAETTQNVSFDRPPGLGEAISPASPAGSFPSSPRLARGSPKTSLAPSASTTH